MSWLSFSSVIGWKTEESGIESIKQLNIQSTNPTISHSNAESFITISDSRFTASDALILDLVAHSLSNNHRVFLIAVNRSINHWTQTAKKRGITQSSNSQFTIIDVNENLTSSSQQSDNQSIDDLLSNIDQLFTPSDVVLANMFTRLTTASNNQSNNQSVTIIFDAVDPLALRFGDAQIHSFLSSLHATINQSNNQSILCVNLYNDHSGDEAIEQSLFHSMLINRSDLNLLFSPLKTGNSKEFIGEVSYERRNVNQERHAYHYRIFEGDVQIVNKR